MHDLHVEAAGSANAAVVTIIEAARQIGCKREFIYDLFKRQKIWGPAYPEGPPRNAPRVYQASIDTYLRGRRQAQQRRHGSPRRRLGSAATDTAILERLDELTRAVQRLLQEQRSRRDEIATYLANVVSLQERNARDQAQAAQGHADALAKAQEAFNQLASEDDRTAEQVLSGLHDIFTTLIEHAARDGRG